MDTDALPPVLTLPDLVRRAVVERPDAEAVTDGRDRLSWVDYDRRIGLVAAALGRAGARRGDRVAVLTPKSVHAFVAVHAIQRAGAVVVPIDWFAPTAVVRAVLADAEPTAVVGVLDAAHRSAVGDGVHIVDPTDPHVLSGTAAAGPVVDEPRPDDPAYIIYTSGSTGRPKGIVHTHASALAYARAAVATYGITGHDRAANIAPLHFDQSTFELYAAPLAGSAAIVVPDGVLRFPSSLARMLAAERATVLYTVPYVIRQLVERGGPGGHDLSNLRWVKFGGESFPPDALAAAMAAIPSARFSNVYGPAEVNQCTFHHVERDAGDRFEGHHSAGNAIPIGRPWEGVDLVVVDPVTGEDVPVGVPGELWVSGPTTMQGYWGRPDLDERALVHRADDARVWYRTGDLVVGSPDGPLVFLGRIDHQVKIRGQRIELEAVDAVLLGHPSVTAATSFVIGSDVTGADDEVVAVVTPNLDEATVDSISVHASERLPRVAVPTRIVSRATLPRTSSGKVDRTASRVEFLADAPASTMDDTR